MQEEAEAQRAAYDKALGDANAALALQFDELMAERAEQDKLQVLINEQYEANRTLREQVDCATEVEAQAAALREQVTVMKNEFSSIKEAMRIAFCNNQELVRNGYAKLICEVMDNGKAED